ncbi:GTP cyclohydrolase II-domain-containing protein [Paraphysoderma sedebokerense]|nr:GTP cyclohydrolase II-domain-containing protein [Paraphysoderma sedebokerense]
MLTHLAEAMTTSFEFTPSHTSSAPSSSTQKSNIQVQCKVRTRIPTSQFGDIYVHLYENNQDDKQHLAIVFGIDIRSKSLETVQPATLKSIPNVKSDLANSTPQSENGNANGTAESVSENVESDLDRFVRGAIPLNSLDSIKHTCAACHDSQIENGHTHNSLPSSPATPQSSSHSSSSNSYFPTITPSTILLNGNTVIQPIRKIHPRHASIPPQQQSILNSPPSSVPPPSQLTKSTPLSDETSIQSQFSASSAQVINTENESKPSKPPLVRIHSECFTGETLFSIRCDCGEQLQQAMKRIMKEGSGVIVYLRQEGRGIGLLDKLRAYNLQDLGHDTVTANLLLHHPADLRSYDIASNILMDLNIENIRLLTNNPDKIEQLEREGVKVTKRVSMVPKSWKKMMMGKNPRVKSGRSRTRKLSQPSNRSKSNLNESTSTKNTLSSSTLPHNNSLSRPYSPVVASTSSPLASSSSLASVSLPAAGDLRNKKQSRSELGMQSTGFDSQNELYIASMGLKHPKEHRSSDPTKPKSSADEQNGTVTDANDVARKEQDCEDDWSDLPQDGTQKIEKPTRSSNLSKPSTHSHSSTSRPTSTSKNSQHRQRRRSQSSHHDCPTSSLANSDEEEDEDTHIEVKSNRSDSKNLEDDLVNRDECETEDDDDEDQDEVAS